jgi:hypothetical protein
VLTPIVQSCLHSDNPKRHQRRVNSRRWDKAPRWIQERVSPQALKTFLVYLQLTHGLPRRIPRRLLASRRGVSMKTAFNHTQELIAAKVLRAVYTKIDRKRNIPNLYILLDIDGKDLNSSSAINYMEKKVQSLKPSTPRAVRVENHSPAMRKLYEHNSRLLKQLRKQEDRKAWRLEKARRRNEMALKACVGMTWTGPVMSDAEAEEIRQRIKARELGRKR